VLIEPLDADPDQAVRRAAEMEDIAIAAGIALEQIHHGDGITIPGGSINGMAFASALRHARTP
jgi:hypothetical protein